MKKIGLFCAVLLGFAAQCFGVGSGVISTTTADGRHVVVKAIDGNIFRVSNVAEGEYDKSTQAAVLITNEFKVLVAPVLAQGAVSRKVVLPAGVWIDYADPAVSFNGPAEITYDAPLNRLPLFIKNGAFIPQATYEMENTGDYDASRYTVLYYPRGDMKSSYTLFEDDRSSNNSLEKGDYVLINFSGDASGKDIKVTIELTGDYAGMGASKTIVFELPGVPVDDISSVKVDGKTESISENMLKRKIILRANKPVNVEIKKKSDEIFLK